MNYFIVLLLSPLLTSRGYTYQFCIDLPDNAETLLDACIKQSEDEPVIPWQAELACLTDYYSNLPPNNMTDEDLAVFERASSNSFEQEMRSINPTVSLPYWDYTIDHEIARPVDSVVWTPCYFGENDDVVKSGPLGNFYGAYGALISRDIAKDFFSTRLIRKTDMEILNEYCYFENITTGADTTKTNHNLEFLHDSVHDYVGADMSHVPISAYDPTFWFHHAFIDYIWEHFREHQTDECDVDIEQDYRPDDDLGRNTTINQGRNDTMFGFSHLRNIDGLWVNWTQTYFKYEPQPACGTSCNGPHLYCKNNRCLSRTNEWCTDKGQEQNNTGSLAPKLFRKIETQIKGLKGDGRTRDTSVADSIHILKLLREEVPTTLEQTSCDSESNLRLAVIVLAVVLGIVLLGALIAVVYCAQKMRSKKENLSDRVEYNAR